MAEILPGAVPYTYWSLDGDQAELVEGGIVAEAHISVYVNAQEIATLMCSPLEQEALALGFLFNEGVIASLDDVRAVQANVARTSVDVFLNRSDFEQPRRLVLTSGCGGVSFQNLERLYDPLETDYTTAPDVITRLMRALKNASPLYKQVRGVHTSILGDESGVLFSAEDVGRHNAIDKVVGKALLAGVSTRDKILLSTGRISSEMLNKARQMGVPVVASHTSPTALTVRLAAAWNICVVGYVRQAGMRVYTHPQRLGLNPLPEATDGHNGQVPQPAP